MLSINSDTNNNWIVFGSVDTSLIEGGPTYLPLAEPLHNWKVGLEGVSMD